MVSEAHTPRDENRSNGGRKSAVSGKRIRSEELLGDGFELIIEHGGQEYRLRKTRLDKLILTK